MSNVEEEGFVVLGVTSNESFGILVNEVSGVALFMGLFATMPPIVLVVVADMAHEVDVATMVSNELIKTMVLWMVSVGILRIPEVPFPKHTRGVASVLQNFGEGGFGTLETLAVFRVV